ncbi:hypothetical protein Acr_01g0011820 [Actinidia rufa]|uniref:Retrotransposon Copia-like N-terminal domain-containing protein n=1 Tax=Actinidia rufa TaxID=165716 RepID=A0A7J0E4E4_9ERIC|nr:hypothetical protein Acr_01g0011820 [Actinidia rufa]
MDDNTEAQPPQQQSSVLQPTPARRITSVPLTSTNFASWSRSVRLYLGARGKLCWLSGDVAKPDGKDVSKLEQWEMDNYTILGWLFNSIDPHLYELFMFHDTA